MFAVFHEIADAAYFAQRPCWSAPPTTFPGPSYPSLFSSVVSVASHDVAVSVALVLQPVAAGRVRGLRASTSRSPGTTVARIVATGNSFAAPHIDGTGRAHPGEASGGDPVRGQDDPGDRRERGPPGRLIRTRARLTPTAARRALQLAVVALDVVVAVAHQRVA